MNQILPTDSLPTIHNTKQCDTHLCVQLVSTQQTNLDALTFTMPLLMSSRDTHTLKTVHFHHIREILDVLNVSHAFSNVYDVTLQNYLVKNCWTASEAFNDPD